MFTEVGQTLDEQRSLLFDQAESSIWSAVELIRTAGDLGIQRGWITGDLFTDNVVEYVPSSVR